MTFIKKELSLEEMVLISIASVLGVKGKCSFGDLVNESFRLFPNIFALSGNPKWPDSLKLDRPLRKLRERGYITGNPTTYFSLTRFGQTFISSLSSVFRQRNILVSQKKPTRNPDLLFLQEISGSEDFIKFLRDKKNFRPNNMRIREITKSTLETPWQNVANYLKHLREIAEKSKQKDLVEYLNVCEIFFQKRSK